MSAYTADVVWEADGTGSAVLSTAQIDVVLDAAVADADPAGSAAAAQSAAESFATTAVAAETSRAEAAESLLAPTASPALTGTPTAPTAAPGTNSTQIATTGFTAAAVAALVNGAPGTLDTLNEIAAALGDDANLAADLTAQIGTKAAQADLAAEIARAKAAERLAPTAVKTGAVTAAAGQMVLCDTTGGAFAVTLPSAPADLTQVGVMCVAGGTTFAPPTVTAGAGDTLGPTVSGSIGQVGETLVLQYQASVKVWRPVAGRLSMAALTAQVNAALTSAKTYTDTKLAAAAAGYAYTGFSWYEQGATAPDTYFALDATGTDNAALPGNTGYTRLTTGTPANPAVQSRMRRCIVADDGSRVKVYLDCDNSALIAGTWNAATSTQTGWVRVYEGPLDPVRPTPGQTGAPNAALRDGIAAWDAQTTYKAGARVTSGGALWDSLNDNNLDITPAAGTAAADLTGGAGQVMVEIPAFYYRMDDDVATAHRHNYEVVFDPSRYRPFPDLSTASTAPTSVTVNGRVFDLHPTFVKAGIQRRARYRAAFQAVATDTGNNGNGVLKSICDGTSTNTTNVANTNFRVKARNRNAGLTDLSGQANDVWSLEDYWMLHAVQLLFFTEYRTLYSQAVVGGGNISGSICNKITGRSAPMGNSSGVCDSTGTAQTPSASGTFDAMSWRGNEDLWGTAWRWLDGANIRNGTTATEWWLSNTPSGYAFATTSGYTLTISAMKGKDTSQYATDLEAGSFLIANDGGSTTTYLTDYYYGNAATDNSWRVPLVGAAAGNAASAGVAAVNASLGAGLAGANVAAAVVL